MDPTASAPPSLHAPATPRPAGAPGRRGRQLPTSRAATDDVARAIHEGRTWGDVAAALGAPVGQVRDHYRLRIRARLLRWQGPVGDGPPHGTLLRYERRCRCDPCLAAHAEYTHRWRAELGHPELLLDDPGTLREVADRLHRGAGWDDIAALTGRTPVYVRHRWRAAVQPYLLPLVERDDPSTTPHPHGSWEKYRYDRCRCEPCTWARLCREQHLRRQRHRQPPTRSADRARQHLGDLADAGVGHRRVAALTGLSRSRVQSIRAGRCRRIVPDVEQRILAVTARDRAESARVDAAATRARLHWLADQGAPEHWVAAQLGRREHQPILSPTARHVSAATADEVAALVTAVRDRRLVPPAAQQALARAADRDRRARQAARRRHYRQAAA